MDRAAAYRHRFATACVALLLGFGVIGCAAAVSPDAESTVPPVTPTTSASPTADAAVTTPVAPFGGDCDALFQEDGVLAAIGPAEQRTPSERWWVGLQRAGGLSCGFSADAVGGSVVILPAALTGSLSVDETEPSCRRAYDEVWCSDTRTGGDFWVLALGVYGDDPSAPSMEGAPVPEVLTELADAVAVAVSDETATPVTPSATTVALPLDCADLADEIDVPSLLGDGEIFPTRIEEGGGPLDRILAEAVAVSGRCDWAELEDFREVGLVVYPDAAWAWSEPELSESLEAPEGLTVSGLDAQVSGNEYRTVVLVSDGTNLVEVIGHGIDTDDLVAATERVLAAVSAP